MTGGHGLVVVGASLAGLRAVEAARKAGFAGPVTLIGAERHLPYDRPPLSKEVLDPANEPPDTTFRTEAHLRDELAVRVLLGTPATGLDPVARTVRVGHEDIAYDSLVIATGVTARSLPGHEDHPRVRSLRTADDAGAIRAAIDRGDRLLIVGCGFIGSEIASALVKRGQEVTLVELADVPLVRAVGERTGHYFAQLHRDHGVDLHLGSKIEAVREHDAGLEIALSDGTHVDADLVVLGLGATPATAWLAGSGIALEVDGSIAADAQLRTNLPAVYAAGDVVTWHNDLFARRMRLEHWTSAAEQGAVAARNALHAGDATSYTTVPYFWSDLYGKRIQSVGVHTTDSVEYADGSSYVVLHRQGAALVGALVVDQPRLTMKLRKIIAERGEWSAGHNLVVAAVPELVRPR